MPKETILKRKLCESKISYRRAAPALGVHWTHLYKVVNGYRKSKSLSLRILQLCNGVIPLPPKPARRQKRRTKN